MTTHLTALVTGANKGIGREIAAQLAELGHTVIIGSRSPERGEAAARELHEAGGDVTAVTLDVTDPASIRSAAQAVQERFGHLDALINNAAISRAPGQDLVGQLPRSAVVDQIRTVFETNVFGVIATTSAFLPLLRESETPRIVNVSSGAGSLAAISDFSDPNPIALGYVSSKTALTSVTMQYARDLHEEGILVNAVCPGFIGTDLNDHQGTGTPAEGARQAVAMSVIGRDGPTGTFTNVDGPIAW
ncbi:dehydrogenase [Brachybacterium endophyticum]|uniref:Dehydrogenase n=1 Tax=Brachybacterium endophyticum TaxID=2182385 RepID=A0A2U2RHF4_9MICO|nr:SDR family oxidoreductase [Brachybacterium endophyticum]PWH05302.1 dehydrogenase [Brachybacterium endophyticum]